MMKIFTFSVLYFLFICNNILSQDNQDTSSVKGQKLYRELIIWKINQNKYDLIKNEKVQKADTFILDVLNRYNFNPGSDSLFFSREIYNELGQLIKRQDYNGDISNSFTQTIYSYDSIGRTLSKIRLDDKCEELSKVVYEYDDSLRIQCEYLIQPEESPDIKIQFFNKNDEVVYAQGFESNGEINYFQKYYYSTVSLLDSVYTERIFHPDTEIKEFKFTKYGKLEREIIKSKNGYVRKEFFYKYDKSGLALEEQTTWRIKPRKRVVWSYLYKYNEGGMLTFVFIKRPFRPKVIKKQYVYQANGLLSKVFYYNDTGEIKEVYHYEYR
jgi:hypothetical protein